MKTLFPQDSLADVAARWPCCTHMQASVPGPRICCTLFCYQPCPVERLWVGWLNWEGCCESRRCSRDTYPEAYIIKYTSVRRLIFGPGEKIVRFSRQVGLSVKRNDHPVRGSSKYLLLRSRRLSTSIKLAVNSDWCVRHSCSERVG